MIKAKKFIYAKYFDNGQPKLTDFALVEEELTELKDGDILAETLYLSVDPLQRNYAKDQSLGSTVIGGQISKVIDSKNCKYPIGVFLFGHFGWRSHTIINPDQPTTELFEPYILPDFSAVPLSLSLGILGMHGNTAYYGMIKMCKLEAKKVVVVSGAAGAIGHIAGQIAKIKDCFVIGITGNDEKCEWLKNDLGFDVTINYKTENIVNVLSKVAPDGVDIYFDNVGGEISSDIISQMRPFGRIVVCGAISAYANSEPSKATVIQTYFFRKQLSMEGFLVPRERGLWMEGVNMIYEWLKEGKIKCNEYKVKGFEKLPQTLLDLLDGKNFGKAIVEV